MRKYRSKKITAEVRRDVLRELANGTLPEVVRRDFSLTEKQLQRVIKGPANAAQQNWGKAKGLAKKDANRESMVLRDRLYDKSVVAVDAGLDRNEDYKRAIIGVKVLEGLGDLHRPAEFQPEPPKDRPALFNLPPGARVDVTVNIRKGARNGDKLFTKEQGTGTRDSFGDTGTDETATEAVGDEV